MSDDEANELEPDEDKQPLRGYSSARIFPGLELFAWAELQRRMMGNVFDTAAFVKMLAPAQGLAHEHLLNIARVSMPLQDEAQRQIAGLARQILPIHETAGKQLAALAGHSFDTGVFSKEFLASFTSPILSEDFLKNIVRPVFTPEFVELIKSAREQWRRASPPNWPEDDFERLLSLVKETGWAVVWVPTEDVLGEVLDAATVEDREAVLVEHGVAVAQSCRDVLTDATTPRLQAFVRAADEAAKAFLEGMPLAAQALANSVVSGLIHEELGYRFLGTAKTATEAVDPDEMAMRHLRFGVILSTVPTVLCTWYPGDPVMPSNFSRHGTAHSVSPDQFKPANALAALMLATSLTREIHQRVVDGLEDDGEPDADEDESST